nr:MAG TPA: hypothetical protein [Caudoviricetes sp.]
MQSKYRVNTKTIDLQPFKSSSSLATRTSLENR